MDQPTKEVSPDTLERLVARALELDEQRNDRISLTKAREIARELGISETAWDAAVAERMRSGESLSARSSAWFRARTLLTAGAGFAAGALGTLLNRALNGDADVAYGALLVAVGVALSVRRRDETATTAQARLDAWWLSVPAGMLVAFGGIRTDPLLFAAFARWGTGWFMSHAPRLLRRLTESESPSATTA